MLGTRSTGSGYCCRVPKNKTLDTRTPTMILAGHGSPVTYLHETITAKVRTRSRVQVGGKSMGHLPGITGEYRRILLGISTRTTVFGGAKTGTMTLPLNGFFQK